MTFQYNKLRGRIKEICETNEEFARRMGLSLPSISQKLNNKSQWTQSEIYRTVIVLSIDCTDIPAYFFTPQVQETKPDATAVT